MPTKFRNTHICLSRATAATVRLGFGVPPDAAEVSWRRPDLRGCGADIDLDRLVHDRVQAGDLSRKLFSLAMTAGLSDVAIAVEGCLVITGLWSPSSRRSGAQPQIARAAVTAALDEPAATATDRLLPYLDRPDTLSLAPSIALELRANGTAPEEGHGSEAGRGWSLARNVPADRLSGVCHLHGIQRRLGDRCARCAICRLVNVVQIKIHDGPRRHSLPLNQYLYATREKRVRRARSMGRLLLLARGAEVDAHPIHDFDPPVIPGSV